MSDKRVKICPSCSQHNRADSLRCEVCERSLAGVVSQISRQPSQGETAASAVKTSLSRSSSSVSAPPNYSSGRPNARTRVLFPVLRQRRVLFPVLIVLFVIAIIVSSLLVFGPMLRSTQISSNQDVPQQLGEFKASNGEQLGINDGSFAPFFPGPNGDGQLKQQAVVQLKQGHPSQAISLWSAALQKTNNDAEVRIYLENQSVLPSGLPYITLVVGIDGYLGSNLSVLQGVYVAQREFNIDNHGFKMRVLIANSGTDPNNVSLITRQIVNIAKQDKTVVGVVSWLTSNENLIALPKLSAAHIPLIAPDAASDRLTNISPYFLRMIAPGKIQEKQDVLFVEQTLHAKKVVVFVDSSDVYSQNAAQDFEDQFTKDGNTILKKEPFTTDKTSNINSLIQDALKTKPDLLLFTSRDNADDANFLNALPTSGPFATLPILVGGAGYMSQKAGYGRWYVNADAFPDEWKNIMGNSSTQPRFYQDYIDAFNEDSQKHGGYYGYTRPDSYAMLSYDAASVFSHAINKIALTTDGLQHITPELLAQTLPQVTFQGVTGWIAFDPAGTGNPIKKMIVFLGVSPKGNIYMKDWQGCFTKTLCRNVS